ncbi:hypothetical protein DRE_01438 [Drechslerella stenobrocha 248]|uniref:Glycoside hydrolase family 76 protein n=1 Tax=Drechslerella stenobrocha 248 TaxID=1043628 RepID=W7HI61_9PEZI|nr:hypothetical protein DRE_01438 [Drechslerella stenobrocha 248]
MRMRLGFSSSLAAATLVALCRNPEVDAYSHQLPLPLSASTTNSHRTSGITLNSTDIAEPLRYLIHAFETLQSVFFSSDRESYPSAIDWTAAVTQTHAVSSLHSVLLSPLPRNTTQEIIDIYFPDIVAFYRGQNVASLKYQAYDDMLWVVLGWLAAVRFLDAYRLLLPDDYNWVYYDWRHDFALRAREFYTYAEKGWDELFCGGGCIWNPNLQPYKNAITNELFIAASVQMYSTFPREYDNDDDAPSAASSKDPHAAYLLNAEKAYAWFRGSNFTNNAGLVVDGFHISSYWKRLCDARDEQTYTYNQGVVLSGLRGLWEATGKQEYLLDGYALVESVIGSEKKVGGLVRGAVLEEHCDSWGWCNQDAQTFKGIFFHHLTAFCSPHPYTGTWSTSTQGQERKPDLKAHLERCKAFFPFVAHSAEAAWSTRDAKFSVFGMWWSAPLFEKDPGTTARLQQGADGIELMRDPRAVDAVNNRRGSGWQKLGATKAELALSKSGKMSWDLEYDRPKALFHTMKGDLNDRFAGRTVETQTGGVGVMRAAWELGQELQPGS